MDRWPIDDTLQGCDGSAGGCAGDPGCLLLGEQHENDYDTRGLLVEMRHLDVASTSILATFFAPP